MKNQCTLFTHFIPVISRFFDPVNVTFKLETKRETKKRYHWNTLVSFAFGLQNKNFIKQPNENKKRKYFM